MLLNCFHSYSTKGKLKKHKYVCENHDYCYVERLKENNKVLKYNHREKSMKAPFVIYADLESLLEKMSTCHNNPTKSSTTKKINTQFLVIHCLQNAHLMLQKISQIVIEVKAV